MNTNETAIDLQPHLNCHFYQKKDSPMFEVINRQQGVEISRKLEMPALVFVAEGEIEFSSGSTNNVRQAHRNEFFMLPADTDLNVRFRETASLICFSIAADTDFCWRIRQKLLGYPSHEAGQTVILSSIDIIRNYIDVFLAITGYGILCVKYLNCQICALLDLICAFYPAESLVDFFEPLRSFAFGKGVNFKQEVLRNRNKLFKVSEFAESVCMSRAAFRRKFVRIFGMCPQKWIIHERMQLIELELKYGTLTVPQIAQKAGFASVIEFYAFCRKHLGKTAAEIRKEGGL
jgi:AraC-like DNA-binding protein